jgi:hypothetical protein
MLAKNIAQLFYVLDTTNKRVKVVIPGKRWIIRIENTIDEEEFDQFDKIPPFITSMIKPRISSASEALYLRNNHHEKVKNFRKPRPQYKIAKWLCKICSMCDNMTICVKIWLSMDIYLKYAQCVKIWPFVWKFDFYWIFEWNMLNVSKYGNLCENVTFIGYLCEICSMCENMAFWCLDSISEVCVVSKVLCSVSDGYHTKSGTRSISDEENGRRTQATCVSYKRRRETSPRNASFKTEEKGDVPTKHASRISRTCVSLLLNMHKKEFI